MSGALFQNVAAALAADGFEPTITGAGVHFKGAISVQGLGIRMRLEYRDLEFAEPAFVFIENPEALPGSVLPHLDEKNELCVVDRRRFVADRYLAASQARGLLVRAREVIEHGLTRHAADEIADEFPQHWGGALIGVEFGAYAGELASSLDAGGFVRMRPRKAKDLLAGRSVFTNSRLSFAPGQKRPGTLADVLAWAAVWDRELPNRILTALKQLTADDPQIWICAPNGVVGFQLLVSSRGRAQVQALARPGAWRRVAATPAITGLAIRRLHGHRVDMDYALNRNVETGSPLAGREITLIGCGSIGGFLARALVQLGAGFGGGRLALIDDETLGAANIGRHILGNGDVGRLKTEGCRRLLLRDFPGVKVLAREAVVQTQRQLLRDMDLLIDATGEQGVSEMLNAWMLEAQAASASFPTLLHVWIEGAGAAAQTFIGNDVDFACFRCLRPDHGAAARYSALADGVVVELAGGCGESVFTPYGPSAPMLASALAAQHAADWAQGRVRPLLRTGRLDWSTTKEVKPANPKASPRCPACRRARG